jgi:hypothetical protein
MDEAAVVLLLVAGALVVGIGVGLPSSQQTINEFKQPVCVERIVGADTIKKCYELKEIK